MGDDGFSSSTDDTIFIPPSASGEITINDQDI